MDLNKFYYKLPKKIKYSKKFILFSQKFVRIFRRNNTSKSDVVYTLNYLFKSSDIKVSGTLRNIQLLYVELLRFIDNVCKKYDLDYFLAYGTLLGAIRHEGFIPWDDDCDIIMMRSDYNKLTEVLPYEINKNKFLKKNMALTKLINPEENYFKECNNIYDKELGHDTYFIDFINKQQFDERKNKNLPIVHKSLFMQLGWLKPMVKLDIFPQDFIKEDFVKYYNKYYSSYKISFRNSFYDKDFNFDKEFNKCFEELGLTLDETKFMGEGIDASGDDWLGVYDTNMFLPPKELKFENYYFKCPNESLKLLERWYGEDYMNIPASIEMHGYPEYNSSFFESDSEMEQYFEMTIKELKKINDSFE